MWFYSRVADRYAVDGSILVGQSCQFRKNIAVFGDVHERKAAQHRDGGWAGGEARRTA